MPTVTFSSVAEIDAASDRLYNYCPQFGASVWPGFRFTGWKYDSQNFNTDDPPKMDSGFVAQWLYSDGDGGRNWYVNLPGMQCGEYIKGGTLTIGTERVYADASKEEIVRLVTEGKAKLVALLEKEGVKIAN